MQLDVLWQFMQVDMEADSFEAKMRQSTNRQKLIKQRNFLMEQQNNMKKLENDVGITDCVGVGMRFLTWLRQFDVEKAIEYNNLFDAFIKDIAGQKK